MKRTHFMVLGKIKPQQQIQQIEIYFSLTGVNSALSRIQFASSDLKDLAATWYSSGSAESVNTISWSDIDDVNFSMLV